MDEGRQVIPRQVLRPDEATQLTGLSRHQLLHPLSARDPLVGEWIHRLDLGIGRVLIVREHAEFYAWLTERPEMAGHPERFDKPPFWRHAASSFSYDEAAALLGISPSSVSKGARLGYLRTVAGPQGMTMVRRDSLVSVLGGSELRDWPPVRVVNDHTPRLTSNQVQSVVVRVDPEPAPMAGESSQILRTLLATRDDIRDDLSWLKAAVGELLELAKGLPDGIERERVTPTGACHECGTPVIYSHEHRLGYSELLVEDSDRGNIVMLTNGRFFKFTHTSQFNEARAAGLPRYRRHDCQPRSRSRRVTKLFQPPGSA